MTSLKPATRLRARRALIWTGLLVAGLAAAWRIHALVAGPSACDSPDHAACGVTAPARQVAERPALAIPEGPAVLELTSEYCPACRKLEPVLEEARRQCVRAGAKLVRVDVDTPDGGALAARYDVTATPTLIFLGADHGEISRQVGAQSLADVRRALEHAYGLECASLPRAAGTGT